MLTFIIILAIALAHIIIISTVDAVRSYKATKIAQSAIYEAYAKSLADSQRKPVYGFVEGVDEAVVVGYSAN